MKHKSHHSNADLLNYCKHALSPYVGYSKPSGTASATFIVRVDDDENVGEEIEDEGHAKDGTQEFCKVGHHKVVVVSYIIFCYVQCIDFNFTRILSDTMVSK
jgi:hypothetical protein